MVQKLSPQQIQLMKLLQIPTATLDQRIKEELEANPALDEGGELDNSSEMQSRSEAEKEDVGEEEPQSEEAFELDDYLQEYIEDDPVSYKLKANHYGSDEDKEKAIPIPVEGTFHDYLEEQLGMLELPGEREKIIVRQIIGSIDDDGYLRRDLRSIVDDLLFAQGIETDTQEIEALLEKVQRFDPPGTGARSLQECLLLQIDQKRKSAHLQEDVEQNGLLEKARQLLSGYFEEFSKKHYKKLARRMGISEDTLREVIDEILKLNPKPASGHATSSQRNPYYIIPDFTVVNREGDLELHLNARNAPDLRVNDQYREMLQAYQHKKNGKRPNRKEKEAVMFIKQKIDAAKWFIDAIRQRQQTMYKTMYAILQYQYDYFLTGDQRRMKPMILKDIADITGLDISTVSRVANSKFVQTEFGIKRLKDFFSESIQTDNGEEVSTFEVKNILSEIIAREDKRKPLSDEKLKNALREKGYQIARRTVAKYREQLNIPVARLRKEL